MGCPVGLRTCTATPELSTKEQLLAPPEPPGCRRGRVAGYDLPRDQGRPGSYRCHRAAQTELSAQPPLGVAARASARLDVVWVWPPSPLLCNPAPPFVWGSGRGCHPMQLWLKRHSRTREGAQRCWAQSVRPVPVLSWLSFCYVQYCKLTLAPVPLLQSW